MDYKDIIRDSIETSVKLKLFKNKKKHHIHIYLNQN